MADPAGRHRKIGRLLAIQGQIHRLAEWRLSALDRQRTALAEDRAELVAALNEDGALQGLFVDAMARRLTVLARENDRLARAREAQHRRLMEEGLRLKRFERATGKAHRNSQELGRRRGFQAILDALSTTDDASLP